ncbi:hypothetical protein ACWKWZ_05300 [Metapseudomonas otitidis]|jgi:hypothetical protein|uniref:hypothetical protein n=1 Tax=Pseudomonadaceae TaxID=135621 RepID=UPI0005E284AC|nr:MULTISPECIES: hypothetical protein [Pseudomonas]KIV71016.1 hypothetical protein SZ55_2604 [Pseudomonas sp. FeS53a]
MSDEEKKQEEQEEVEQESLDEAARSPSGFKETLDRIAPTAPPYIGGINKH